MGCSVWCCESFKTLNQYINYYFTHWLCVLLFLTPSLSFLSLLCLTFLSLFYLLFYSFHLFPRPPLSCSLISCPLFSSILFVPSFPFFLFFYLLSSVTLSSCVWWGFCAARWWWESEVVGWLWTSFWSKMIRAEVSDVYSHTHTHTISQIHQHTRIIIPSFSSSVSLSYIHMHSLEPDQWRGFYKTLTTTSIQTTQTKLYWNKISINKDYKPKHIEVEMK